MPIEKRIDQADEARLDDSTLVVQARSGDQEAFGQLALRHRQRCVTLASFILRNVGDAEDEAQNALHKAFQHLDQFQGEGEFGSWLSRILVNQCRMLIREKGRVRMLYLDSVVPATNRSTDLPCKRPNPEKELGGRQLRRVLSEQIRRIPLLLRNVVILHDLREMPMHEVAQELGITVPAAKSRLARARTELRSRMLRHFDPHSHHGFDHGSLCRIR